MAKSITYKMLTKIGINLSTSEYQEISFFGALKRGLNGYFKSFLLKYFAFFSGLILESLK